MVDPLELFNQVENWDRLVAEKKKKVESLLSKEIPLFPVVSRKVRVAILLLFETEWKLFKMEE